MFILMKNNKQMNGLEEAAIKLSESSVLTAEAEKLSQP